MYGTASLATNVSWRPTGVRAIDHPMSSFQGPPPGEAVNGCQRLVVKTDTTEKDVLLHGYARSTLADARARERARASVRCECSPPEFNFHKSIGFYSIRA